MSAIVRHYSSRFFDWPITKAKRSQAYLQWNSNKNEVMTVFHPYINFDPISTYNRQDNMIDRGHSTMKTEDELLYNSLKDFYIPEGDEITPIVHETIKVHSSFFENLEIILEKIESNFKVPEDNWLWDETGHWTAKDKNQTYIGMSEENAFELWRLKDQLSLCFVVSSTSIILEFYLNPGNDSHFSINIYYANRFLPFPDLINAVHEALNYVGKWETTDIEKDDESVIFRSKIKRTPFEINRKPKTFLVSPKWVRPISNTPRVGYNFYDTVVIENTFFPTQETETSATGYALIKFRQGYWYNSDFENGTDYYLISTHARQLSNCILADLWVDRYFEEDEDYDSFQ
jgi:hypothetical protein